MPGPLISRQDIADGSISSQPRKFSKLGGKMRAARVFFYFKNAGVAVGMPHALGRTPTAWRQVSVSRISGQIPGVVFARIQGTASGSKTESESVHTLGRNYVVLACETANTWAEIEVT